MGAISIALSLPTPGLFNMPSLVYRHHVHLTELIKSRAHISAVRFTFALSSLYAQIGNKPLKMPHVSHTILQVHGTTGPNFFCTIVADTGPIQNTLTCV